MSVLREERGDDVSMSFQNADHGDGLVRRDVEDDVVADRQAPKVWEGQFGPIPSGKGLMGQHLEGSGDAFNHAVSSGLAVGGDVVPDIEKIGAGAGGPFNAERHACGLSRW